MVENFRYRIVQFGRIGAYVGEFRTRPPSWFQSRWQVSKPSIEQSAGFKAIQPAGFKVSHYLWAVVNGAGLFPSIQLCIRIPTRTHKHGTLIQDVGLDIHNGRSRFWGSGREEPPSTNYNLILLWSVNTLSVCMEVCLFYSCCLLLHYLTCIYLIYLILGTSAVFDLHDRAQERAVRPEGEVM